MSNSKIISIRKHKLPATHPARRIARVGKLLDAGLIDKETAEMRLVELAAEAWEAMERTRLKMAA